MHSFLASKCAIAITVTSNSMSNYLLYTIFFYRYLEFRREKESHHCLSIVVLQGNELKYSQANAYGRTSTTFSNAVKSPRSFDTFNFHSRSGSFSLLFNGDKVYIVAFPKGTGSHDLSLPKAVTENASWTNLFFVTLPETTRLRPVMIMVFPSAQ